MAVRGRQRTFLGLLALKANSAVRRDLIVDALWSNDPPGSAAGIVQTCSARRSATSPTRFCGPPNGGEGRLFAPIDAELYGSKGALALLSDEAVRRLFGGAELASLDRILVMVRQLLK